MRVTFDLLKRLLFILVLVVIAAGVGLYLDWNWKRPLSPRGGRYFFHRVELPVPPFWQGDEKWRDDPLCGNVDNGTLGGDGCADAALAMVHKFCSVGIDPQPVNWFLKSARG